MTGGARRFVKVFDILFDTIKNKHDYQKKWQNPQGLTFIKLFRLALCVPCLFLLSFFVFKIFD